MKKKVETLDFQFRERHWLAYFSKFIKFLFVFALCNLQVTDNNISNVISAVYLKVDKFVNTASAACIDCRQSMQDGRCGASLLLTRLLRVHCCFAAGNVNCLGVKRGIG